MGDTLKLYCIPCDDNCRTCDFSIGNKCLTCKENMYLLNDKCVTICPDKYYKTNGVCKACPVGC